MSNLAQLSQTLGYTFDNISLLERALCHRSHSKENNERLEFLGDGMVNFVIAEQLFKQFPNAKEGELSRLRASLVNGETLAMIAREFEISQYVKLGHGEKISGGANRTSILADAMEAIIGAIYLDSNFETCRKVIINWYSIRLQDLDSPEALKDPKTALQEILQSKKFPVPTYTIIKTQGAAHKQIFFVECRVDGLLHKAMGKGSSRRRAEQAAASNYLEILKNGK